MGGKANQTQRTKNSVRPSSSGRSAVFLQGTSSYTFSGFVPTEGIDSSPLKTKSEAPINEEIAIIDPNIQVVLKKLTKKDSVTKGKALQELTHLIEDSDIDIVKAVLPLWPRLYKTLYADISHRVREYCQQAHKAFVVKLGKQIAPILKQLFPEWIGSQFDTYAPAASVAANSLATAFPSHKLKDVLAFCHDEILNYVYRMLLVTTPMPADNSYTPEEWEARSERIVCMGLFAYNFYLSQIELGLWREKLEKHQAIVSDGQFWSYAKHKSPQVKAAWLEAVGSILNRTTGLVDGYYPKIVSSIVNNLDEADALVQSAAWTCLLRIQLLVPDWVVHTNMEKALLVKLRKVLQEPHQGITMHLLPFVSHMNQKVLGSHAPRFFTEFFESLQTAITKTRPTSGQELKVLVDTYFECLHYVMKQLQTETELIQIEATEWKRCFVEKFMVQPMEWAVRKNPRALRHMTRNVGLILGYWEANDEMYQELWNVFWEALEKCVLKKTEEGEGESNSVFTRNKTELIISLRMMDVSKSPQNKAKAKSVRFGEESDSIEVEESATVQSQTLRRNNWEELFKLADKMVQLFIDQLMGNPNAELIKLLHTLLVQFDDSRLPNAIDKAMPLASFVSKVMEWIRNDLVVTEEMVDLLVSYGSKASTIQDILEQLMAVDNYSVKNWTVLRISKDLRIDLSECKSISVYMEHILVCLINGSSSCENTKILQTFFEKTMHGKWPSQTHQDMVDKICTAITAQERVNQQLNLLARHLLERVEAKAETTEIIRRLFLAVFHLNLNGVDAMAGLALRDVVNSGKVFVDRSLLALCMEQVKGKLIDLFAAHDFHIDSVIDSCLLLVAANGQDNLEIILSYTTTEESDAYLEHLVDIISFVTAEAEAVKSWDEPLNSTNHLQSLMSVLKCATLKAKLIAKGESVDTAVYLQRTVDLFVTVQSAELEDDQVAVALTELIAAMGIGNPPKLTELPAGNVQPSDFSPETDNLSRDLSNIRKILTQLFNGNSVMNTREDKNHICHSLELLNRIISLSKAKTLNLMYNMKHDKLDDGSLFLAADLAVVLRMLLENCPSELTPEQWDFLRISLSSWILTISNSLGETKTRPVMIRFVVVVLKLFAALMTFFESERQKSSTQLFCKVIEEWNSVFAREVNTVLLLVLHKLLVEARVAEKNKYLLAETLVCFESINFIYLVVSKNISKEVSQHKFLHALFLELSNPVSAIAYSTLRIAKCVVPHLVLWDNDQLLKHDLTEGSSFDEHYPGRVLAPIFQLKDFNINELVEEFQYKATETGDAMKINGKCTAFFYLWDIMLEFCQKATPELRAFYAKWIASQGSEGVLLKMVFRVLPQDVLRNFEAKSSMVETYINSVKALRICDKTLNTEQMACYTYVNLVRLLPAVVRKFWTNLPHRTNMLIEKFNMFYVSGLLCQEELRALIEKRERMDNIQISVHKSTREIIAVYAKEEARMELMITLPPNYPLAVAKVEGGKSVNSRIQSKEVLMQLNLFLSHQNGTIFNGLSLWKRNLDKKFEGVEECYVCYSVIHQDTYQLPKLTCKTCKKKFHSPCLYRWFSTSNKSTCPICRNIF